MSAMERLAWFEVLVALGALVFVSALYPFLGDGAAGGFGLLGLLGFGPLFIRKCGQGVVVDERDREIERVAMRWGINVAWQFLVVFLIALVLWSGSRNAGNISVRLVNWLIWIQFAACYGVKGLIAIVLYRRQRHAA